jgi:sterol desaturase/sphingolipid hydroxylase (fatty acid hydroxylase superfamily)
MCTNMHMNPSRLLFPLLLLLPSAATAWLVSRAVPGAVALTASTVLVLLVTTAIERWRPFRAAWNATPRAHLGTDLAYIALASFPDRLARVAVEAAGVALLGAVGVAGAAGSSSLMSPTAWAVGVAAFVIADLGKYALHRASHEHPWLWRFHFAHHQPARLVASNALRLHPVNMAYNAATDALVAVALGVAPEIAAVFATLRATVGVVQHANVALESQRQWLVNAPSYHRLHHAIDVDTANHNYASTLLVWDRLFGTLLRGPAPDVVGIATPHRQAQTYRGQLVQAVCTDRLDTTCVLARWPWLTR